MSHGTLDVKNNEALGFRELVTLGQGLREEAWDELYAGDEGSWVVDELTSVGEPKSAEGLQVLVSGRAVPALLRTGEEGAAPAGGSGTLEACRRMPCLWRRAQVELQESSSSYSSWTCSQTGGRGGGHVYSDCTYLQYYIIMSSAVPVQCLRR